MMMMMTSTEAIKAYYGRGRWGWGVGGGQEFICLTPTRCTYCHHQNDSALRGSCVSHFNVSLIVWAKSQDTVHKDTVHKPQFLKRKESRSGSHRGPSAYQPSAFRLGHAGSEDLG